MSSNENQTPGLATILKTLESLASQNRQQGQPSIQNQDASFPPRVEHPPAHQWWHQNVTQVAELPRTSTPVNPAIKIVDPATITEWSAGLRCVMKTVAKHENMLHDIRRVSHQRELSLAKLTVL
jgi:hypothetical protein